MAIESSCEMRSSPKKNMRHPRLFLQTFHQLKTNSTLGPSSRATSKRQCRPSAQHTTLKRNGPTIAPGVERHHLHDLRSISVRSPNNPITQREDLLIAAGFLDCSSHGVSVINRKANTSLRSGHRRVHNFAATFTQDPLFSVTLHRMY
jgi:hypothetical protein